MVAAALAKGLVGDAASIAAKKAAKEAAENAAKKAAKEAAEKAAKKAATEAAEKAAKEVAEKAAKEAAEKAAKEAGEKAAKEAAEAGATKAAQKAARDAAIKKTLKKGVKVAAVVGGAMYLSNEIGKENEKIKECASACLPLNYDELAYGDLEKSDLVYATTEPTDDQPVCSEEIEEDCGEYCTAHARIFIRHLY